MHRLSRRFLSYFSSLALVCLGLLSGTAHAAEVCLVAPRADETVWLRDEHGQRLGEEVPHLTPAESHRTTRTPEGRKIAEVELEGGVLAWVSSRVVKHRSLCHPNEIPEDDPLPDEPSAPDHRSLDPFGCNTSTQPDACNLTALRDYATQGRDRLSYKQARTQLFTYIDVVDSEAGRRIVKSIYSNESIAAPSNVPDANHFNTEHVLPQKRLRTKPDSFKSSRTDLFHLFACASWVNSRRGHMPFSEINNGEKVGESETDGNRFEPPRRSKGLVARAMMYASLVYGLKISPDEEASLRMWHNSYPVTEQERARTRRVTEVQGNRNPFVEHPAWSKLVKNF